MSRLLVAGMLALAIGRAAQTVRPAPRLGAYYKVLLTYDDNVFRYSDEDLDVFRMGVEPQRFQFRSADDLDVTLSAGIRYRFRAGARYGDVGVRFKTHQYVSNTVKSYGLATVELGLSPWDRAKAEFGFTWMSSYLIRYYRPQGMNQYQACRFTEYLATAGFRQDVGPLSLKPEYAFEADDYADRFDYYDTKAHRPGVEVEFELVRGLDLGAGYELKLASARGPVPDISYRQHGIKATVSSRPENFRQLRFTASYEVRLRAFTTRNSGEEDPSHAEREDRIEVVDLEVGYRLGTVEMLLGYGLEWREVSSPYSEYIEDVKQYGQSRVSVGAVLTPKLRTGSQR